MTTEKPLFDSGIIEVPPELRGPSNEEILQNEGRADTPMRRRAAGRPSKRERERRKMMKSRADMQKIAVNYAENAPRRPVFDQNPAVSRAPAAEILQERPASRLSAARKKLESLFTGVSRVLEKREIPQESPAEAAPKAVEPPKPVVRPEPPSGRVLKGSFGAKAGEESHAKVYSAAELNRIRMEERAKKIREVMALKNKVAPPVGPDGQPVKRPRGRPRKNPLPQ